jgi:hypothetical protein
MAEVTNETIEGVYSSSGQDPIAWDDSEWDSARPVHITQMWSGDPAPAPRHSEARILWTNHSLLVRFVCRQEEPLVVCPTPKTGAKTVKLWDRDVCEIFVAPQSETPNRYFEFQASPAGEWIDIEISLTAEGRKTDLEFQSGMKSAATILPKQTIITIAIPWSSRLPKPNVDDVWRVNLFRCIGSGDERYLAWQPTLTSEPNFHVPSAFGRLKFR